MSKDLSMKFTLNYRKIFSYQNILIATTCILILLFAYCIKKSNREYSGHYKQMTSFHFRQDKNLPPDLIYFIGDSHTQGLATQAITPYSVNYGIGSDTTEGVLKRIKYYHSIKRAKAVVIAIGFNDLKSRNNSEILKNLRLITKILPSDKPIFINTILPVSNKRFSNDFIKRIIKLNISIIKLCHQQLNLHCINAYNNLSTPDNSLKEHLHIGDGLHLNHTGYDIWIREIKISILNANMRLNNASPL